MSHENDVSAQNGALESVSLDERAEGYLETCPEAKRARYRAQAQRAAAGQRAPAMRLKCLDCVCWNEAEIRRCQITGCPLWPFRLGKVIR